MTSPQPGKISLLHSLLLKQSNRRPSASAGGVNNVYCSVPHRSLNLICPQSKRVQWGGQKTIHPTHALNLQLVVILDFHEPWRVHLSKCEMRTTQRLPYVARELLRKSLFSYYSKSYRPSFSHSNRNPLKLNPPSSGNDTGKRNSSLKQPINCHWAVTAEKMLSWGVLSHRPELLPCSCIRHLPAERLFANAVRDKHVSHGRTEGGKKNHNKQTEKHREIV